MFKIDFRAGGSIFVTLKSCTCKISCMNTFIPNENRQLSVILAHTNIRNFKRKPTGLNKTLTLFSFTHTYDNG